MTTLRRSILLLGVFVISAEGLLGVPPTGVLQTLVATLGMYLLAVDMSHHAR
jgi:hypothetical protein